MKKQTLYKDIESLKQKIMFEQRQLDDEETSYDLLIKSEKERLFNLQQQIHILQQQQSLLKQTQDNNDVPKERKKIWELFPIPNIYNTTRKPR